MNSFDASDRPGQRGVVVRLEHLLTSIEGLGQRLREGLAQALGNTISAAIQDAISRALTGRPPPPQNPYYAPEYAPYAAERERDYDPYDDCRWDDRPAYLRDDEAEPDAAPKAKSPSRWQGALVAGLQAAAFWLRQWAGPRAALAAVGVGAATAALAYLAGPIFGAAAAAVSAGLALLALADATRLNVARLLHAVRAA